MTNGLRKEFNTARYHEEEGKGGQSREKGKVCNLLLIVWIY